MEGEGGIPQTLPIPKMELSQKCESALSAKLFLGELSTGALKLNP
jgi:hypothetical protein